jgi:SulP family sulfate permease
MSEPSGWLSRFFPFLTWRSAINPSNLRADFTAGLIGALIVLPQGVAFATLAGMPPEYGLYAAMVPAVVAALWGSSFHLVSGPTNAISLVVFATVSPLAIPGTADYVALVLTLTFMVGIMQLAMGLARLGALVNFISHTVVIGFTAGAAMLIIASQVKNFFGLDIPRGAVFFRTFQYFFAHLADIKPWVFAVGMATLGSGIMVRKLAPRIPYMIVAMLVGSFTALGLNRWLGQEVTGISTLGALPGALPPLSAPRFSLETMRDLLTIAIAVTALAITEAVSIARSIAVKSGQRIDGNQEFIGQGLSNIVGAFFSAYPASGSFNRSGVNFEAGARTPLAAVFSAACLIIVLIAVAPLAAYLPIASMAAILFLVAWGLFDFHHFAVIARSSRAELAVLVATFLATLVIHLEVAILLGIVMSMMFYLNRTSQPLIRPVGPRFRASATQVPPDRGERGRMPAAQDHSHRGLALFRRGKPRGGSAARLCRSVSGTEAFAADVEKHQLHRHRRSGIAGSGSAQQAAHGRRAVFLRSARARRRNAHQTRLCRSVRQGPVLCIQEPGDQRSGRLP